MWFCRSPWRANALQLRSMKITGLPAMVNYMFYLEKGVLAWVITACDSHTRRKQETILCLAPELIPLPGHRGVTGDFFGIHIYTRTAHVGRDYSVRKAPPLVVRRDKIEL